MKPLLAVDGDSFAHRAFHALPKTFRRDDGGPANTLIGFMSMLLRLWQAERPRAVVVGWDTLFVPTYRNGLLETYQSGREFDPEIVEQLALLPALVSATGIVCGKQEGFEADDFLAAAVAGERARGGTTLVATSDRDAYQLAAPDVTILQPVRGVSELARIGPAEVRERYGVDPQQVCDFIALRGDPSDKIPGARGIGEKTAATLLQTYPDLESMIAAGRFGAEAEKLRTYRHIATLDPTAPLPDVPDLEPDWAAGARAAEELGVERLASRLREARRVSPIEPVSHPAMAHLHPTGHHHHPESEHRLRYLIDALRPEIEGGRASAEAIERVHDPDYVARIAALSEECWLDGDTIGQPTTWEAARLAAGCSIRAVEIGGFALVRPPGHHALYDRAMGFCIFGNVVVAARHAQEELGIERIAIVDWDVHHGNGTEALVRGDDSILFVSLHEWPFYPGTGGPGTNDETIVNIPLAAGSGDAAYAEAFRDDRRARRALVRAGAADRLGRVRRPRRRPARPHGGDGRRVPRHGRALHAARAAGRRRARRRLQPRDAARPRRGCARRLQLVGARGRPESAQRNGRGAARPSRCGSTPLAPARNLRARSMRRPSLVPASPGLDERHPSRWGIRGTVRGGASAGPWPGARAPRDGTRHRACGAGS